ncbi:MAG: holo-acyl-carrier-protein synthase [Anaerocolumna sp.]|jgi:holo-[acyl-carrier protein] synthase|nr:holo-acyl-carrier-protein synthase [Anaerocolumna sp.]
MIVGIGTDLIEIDRIVKACENDAFLNKIYTENEQKLAILDKNKLAGNFAVKEAIVKMIGTGFRGIKPIEVEVLRDELGKPFVNLYGGAKEQAKLLGITSIYVSITNVKEYASAVAVGESLPG